MKITKIVTNKKSSTYGVLFDELDKEFWFRINMDLEFELDTPFDERTEPYLCVVSKKSVVDLSRRIGCSKYDVDLEAFAKALIDGVRNIDPELGTQLVSECVYRNGICPYEKSCGYIESSLFNQDLIEYIKNIKHVCRHTDIRNSGILTTDR